MVRVYRRNTLVLTMALSLVAPFTLFTGSAQAIPTNFADKNACITELSRVNTAPGPRRGLGVYTKPELIQYGKTRVQIRQSKMQLVEKALNATRANFNYYNDRLPKVQAAVNAINSAKTESLEGLPNDPAQNANLALVPGRNLNMQEFEIWYGHATNVLNGAGGVLGSGDPAKAGIVEAACSSIFDAQVFSVVIPLAKRQYILSRIDIQNLMNVGLNGTRWTVMNYVYGVKKATDPGFDANGAIKASPGFQSDPGPEQLELGVLTGWAGGDAVALNNKLNELAARIDNKNNSIGDAFSTTISTQVKIPQATAQ